MNGTAAHGAVVLFSAPDLRLSARRLRFRAPALDAAAVSLGILAGTLTRRVVPAMALTAAAFVVTRLGVGLIARPHFLAPLHRVVPVVGGVLRRLVPVADYRDRLPLSPEQLREWALMDTHDMLITRHTYPQRWKDLQRWMDSLEDVRRPSRRDMAAVGRVPSPSADRVRR